ncbi:hypothetical protein YYC_04129 [Plasmodium yoelii 17X]|uniref:YIR protein n=1 Tax=Plasmodium yoelii 17X TaxID=1323249 RepID=V7PEQ0_PLAYE|nr:hypothetical protein YYC_04129 [Plasmodium yoelii 17X]
MYYRLCTRFDNLRKYFPDELGKTALELKSLTSLNNYCSNEETEGTKCKTDIDKINAGCLWLFDQTVIINFDNLSNDESKRFIIYIMIWLNFKLNQKSHEGITTFNDFYTKHIENNKDYNNCKKKIKNNNYNDCSDTLNEKTGYKSFKEFIEKNGYLMNINIMSKFYDAFKSLCNMYTELDASKPECKKYLEKGQEFVEKYKELNDNSSISGDSSYREILSNLSTDYNNFKDYCKENKVDCNDIPDLSSIKPKENLQSFELSSEPNSEVTSSGSSITNKLIIVLSIFSAIPICLGISYKYSLFGFRKRAQKQHLREKLKK